MTVYIDTMFPLEHVDQVKGAIKDWNDAVGKEIYKWGGVSGTSLSRIFWLYGEDKKSNALGRAFSDGPCTVYIYGVYWGFPITKGDKTFVTDMGDDYLQSTLAHELMHCFVKGYHSAFREDLMYPMMTGPKRPTQRDVDKFKEMVPGGMSGD